MRVTVRISLCRCEACNTDKRRRQQPWGKQELSLECQLHRRTIYGQPSVAHASYLLAYKQSRSDRQAFIPVDAFSEPLGLI